MKLLTWIASAVVGAVLITISFIMLVILSLPMLALGVVATIIGAVIMGVCRLARTRDH